MHRYSEVVCLSRLKVGFSVGVSPVPAGRYDSILLLRAGLGGGLHVGSRSSTGCRQMAQVDQTDMDPLVPLTFWIACTTRGLVCSKMMTMDNAMSSKWVTVSRTRERFYHPSVSCSRWSQSQRLRLRLTVARLTVYEYRRHSWAAFRALPRATSSEGGGDRNTRRFLAPERPKHPSYSFGSEGRLWN